MFLMTETTMSLKIEVSPLQMVYKTLCATFYHRFIKL